MTDGDHTYHRECCVMYSIVKSLCCVPGTNITLYVNYTSIIYFFYIERNMFGSPPSRQTVRCQVHALHGAVKRTSRVKQDKGVLGGLGVCIGGSQSAEVPWT